MSDEFIIEKKNSRESCFRSFIESCLFVDERKEKLLLFTETPTFECHSLEHVPHHLNIIFFRYNTDLPHPQPPFYSFVNILISD